MNLYEEVSKVDDVDWVKEFGANRSLVTHNLDDIDEAEAKSLLADYVGMVSR